MEADSEAKSYVTANAASRVDDGLRAFIDRALPWLFLVYAVPAVIFLSIAMPPLQVTDEHAHFFRADQVSRGGLVPERLGGEIGGGAIEFAALYNAIPFHPEVKQTPALAQRAKEPRWSQANRRANFQNTAQYGPLLYAPQALGIRVGRLAGLRVARTLVIARVVNALAACTAGFLALLVCRRGRALTFFALLLPMSLSEFGSVSQDALIISLSILVVAVASRVVAEKRPAGIGEFALFAFVVAATTMARPAQVALGLLAPAFLGRGDPGWRKKALTGAVAIAVILGWFPLLLTLLPPTPAGWSVAEQFRRVIFYPLALPTAMVRTFADQGQWLLETVVGQLGWLDTSMPRWYYRLSAAVFVCALIAPGNSRPNLRPALTAAVVVVALITTVGGALYLSWTPVGKPTIDGLQGRYFLPVLPLLGWLVPAYPASWLRLLRPLWYVPLVFPAVTIATLPFVIMHRYYESWSAMGESLAILLL